MSGPAPVRSLFVTLKRSFAGTREHHVRILRSLGFSYRQQTVEKPNSPHIRGALEKASGARLLPGCAAPAGRGSVDLERP